MNNEQQELLDEAYENYLNKVKNYTTEDLFYNKLSGVGDVIEGMLSTHTRDFIPYSQEEFINKCKTDPEFSERWGLKINERELSLEERAKWLQDNKGYDLLVGNLDHDHIIEVVEKESPTKLIIITHNGKTIESYE